MIKHVKPDCLKCRGKDRTRFIHIAFGRVPGKGHFSDVWVCSRHGIHIKEVEGTLK